MAGRRSEFAEREAFWASSQRDSDFGHHRARCLKPYHETGKKLRGEICGPDLEQWSRGAKDQARSLSGLPDHNSALIL